MKKPEHWPKVWTLSNSVDARLYQNGTLRVCERGMEYPASTLTKAEVRRLFVRLKSLYRE